MNDNPQKSVPDREPTRANAGQPMPSRFCDLVMKGGITSGVVFPRGITTLSAAFRFKNIGGTSAGAIAAAAAAAAELGRVGALAGAGAGKGFDRFDQLPDFLGAPAPAGGGTNLLAFFQPQPETRSYFQLGLAFLGGARVRLLPLAAWQHPVIALLASLPAVVLAASAWAHAQGWFLGLCLFFAALLLLIFEVIALAVALACGLAAALPNNFYGLCTGMDGDGALTPWLAGYLNELAGRGSKDPPLTFEHLWGTRDPAADRVINLEMMTTNLTHGRPYRLPFRDDELVKENRLFYFRREDFDRLFPAASVQWMLDHPRPLSQAGDADRRAALAQAGFFPLPAPADLPVVVAVRMSLSFPILLSAIPLYAFDRTRDPKGLAPERCWFSDGGICSNFPVHFFDGPLPSWPTLSMDLEEMPKGMPPAALLTPWMVKRNSDGIRERWNRFEVEEELSADGKTIIAKQKSGFGKLGGFVWAIVATMQNWSDNTQSRLPGYRDRIAHVGLTPDEGGLNLNMPPSRIQALTARGKAAGEEFIHRFGYPATEPEMNWDNHRWLRLRSKLDSLSEMLGQFERACAQPQPLDRPYEEWVQATAAEAPPSYPWANQSQQKLAAEAVHDLRAQARKLNHAAATAVSLSQGAPAPSPELRVRPRI